MTKDMDPGAALARSRKAKGKGKDEDEREPGELPPVDTFHIDVVDGRGKHFVGKFTYKVPQMGDQIEIGAVKSGYLPAGCMADPQALFIAEMIAYTYVCITDAPDWWKPHLFYDAKPLEAVYARCRKYEDRFHGRDADGGSDRVGSGREGAEDDLAAEDGGDGDVGGELRAPAKRREILAGDGS